MAAPISQHAMSLEDWLDDLYVRFIINIPDEDLSEVARLCFAIEEAHWYYEDFVRPLDPNLPTFALRDFVQKVFEHCPILSDYSKDHSKLAFEQFMAYKKRIPVRGVILLNHAMDKVVLVKGWKKNSNWSFPRGKVNKGEAPLDCAIRELYEETGYNVLKAGLVPEDGKVKFIDMEMKEQEIRLYAIRNVPEDTVFQPQTRCEISDIRWWKISDLPAFRRRSQRGEQVGVGVDAASRAGKFYMVAPFLDKLKKWVVQQKKHDAERARIAAKRQQQPNPDLTEDEAFATDAYQTDAQTGRQDALPPKAEDIADANAELKRLLNIRDLSPVEPQVPPSNQPVSNDDRGSKLLSLLQGGAGNTGNNISAGGFQSGGGAGLHSGDSTRPLPHTPLDHTYGEAPQPQSPQQHHTQQPPSNFETYSPPPPFPYNPTHEPNFAPQYYQAQAAPNSSDHPRHAQERVNPMLQQAFMGQRHLRDDSIPLVHPQPKPPQVQTGLLTHGIRSTPEVRTAPVAPPNQTAIPHQQQYQGANNSWQQQQQQPQQAQMAQRGPQQIPHPMSQQMPQQISQQMSRPMPQQMSQQQYQAPQAVLQPPANNQQPIPPPLSSHSMSLLSQFKGNEPKPPGTGPGGGDVYGFPQAAPPHSAAVPRQPPVEHSNSQAHHQEQSATCTSQAHAKQPVQQHAVQPAQVPNPTSVPTDAHKSSLLSLFKHPAAAETSEAKPRAPAGSSGSPANSASQSAGSRPPVRRISGSQAYGAIENQGNGVSLAGHEARRPGGQGMTQSESLRAAARESGGPMQMHPDSNLPYRATAVLIKPTQVSRSRNSPTASNTSFTSPKAPYRTVGSPLSNQYTNKGVAEPSKMASPRSKAIHTQKRPEPLVRQSLVGSQGMGSSQLPIGSPHGSSGERASPQVASSLASTESYAGPKGGTDEHKKSLLALFGGGDEDPAGLSSGVGKGKAPGYAGSGTDTPRSHALSIASGSFGMGGSMGGSMGLHQQQGHQHPKAYSQGPPSVASVSMSRQGSHQTSASRGGSQTPISPADRDFLLGYLSTKIDRSSASSRQGGRQ